MILSKDAIEFITDDERERFAIAVEHMEPDLADAEFNRLCQARATEKLKELQRENLCRKMNS